MKRFFIWVVVSQFFLTNVFAAANSTETSPEIPKKISPVLVVGGVAVGIVGISLLDETIRNHLYPWKNTDPSEDLRDLGDRGQLIGPVVGTLFGIQGLATNNQKSKDTAILSYESFIVAGAICGVIKFAVGRERPETTDDAYQFNPGSSDSSFPSGHTTVSFAAATIFAEQYPRPDVIILSYVTASAIGFSRMYANKHWFSDVVAGAALGTYTSHLVRKHYYKHKKTQSTWLLGPSEIKWVMKF